MTNKKYELTEESKTTGNTTLYRIKALRDFRGIKAGDLGGWIEKEANLSHDNDCWVFGNARIEGNAQVDGNARIEGNARVYGYARVYGDAWVYDDARVYGDAQVDGNARIEGNALVGGYARVYGDAWVCGDAWVEGNALVGGYARVHGNASVCGDAWVEGNALVGGYARVHGNASVCGDAWVCGDASVCEGEYTSTVINIILPQYSITVLSTRKLQIGCQLRTIEEWKTTTLEQAVGMGLKEENYELFMKYINILQSFSQKCR